MSSSHPDITANVDRLERRRAEILDELRQVDEDLSLEKNKLADLPNTIAGMERRKHAIAKKAQAIRQEERPIPGSADADLKEIAEVDRLCVDAINVIHSLGIV